MDERHSPPEPLWNYGDLLLFLILAVPCFAVAGIAALAIAYFFPNAPEGVRLVPPQFLGYALWFASLWFILHFRYKAPFWQSLEWNWPARRALLFLALGSGLAVAVGILGAMLKTPALDSPMERLMSDPLSAPLIAVFAVTLGPLCEELAFRGFLLPLVARTLGTIAGVLVSALPFALLHGPQYSWSWRHVLLVMGAGAAFGWVRLSANSTGASTLVHAGYNGMFLAAWFLGRNALGDPW